MASAAPASSIDAGKTPGSAPARPSLWATLSRKQILVTLGIVAALVWAMWATREIAEFGDRRIVAVRLTGIVNEFVEAEARSNSTPEQITQRTSEYMRALEAVLKVRSDAGQTVLVSEAVVSSSAEDITDAVRAEVARTFGSGAFGSPARIGIRPTGASAIPPEPIRLDPIEPVSSVSPYGSPAPGGAVVPSGSPLSPFGGAVDVSGR